MNEVKVRPAEGKLGVMCVGLGAVTTTTIIGVLMARKGLSKPVGSFACEGIMRVGKGKDKCYKEVKDIVSLAHLDDIVFGAWDLYEDDAYDAAVKAAVLKPQDVEPVKDELKAIRPYKALFDKFSKVERKDYVTMALKPNLHQFKFMIDVLPFRNNKHWSFTAGFFVGPSTVGYAENLEKEALMLEGVNAYNDIYRNYPEYGINGSYLHRVGKEKDDPFYKHGLAGFCLGRFADGDMALMVPGEDASAKAEMVVNKVRPYVGFGYNTSLSEDKRWRLNVDAARDHDQRDKQGDDAHADVVDDAVHDGLGTQELGVRRAEDHELKDQEDHQAEQ